MTKFKFQISKILIGGNIWEHEIVVTANDKLEATAKVQQMFAYPDYECEFIEIC